jgi:tetratricopeptide (TPR) repeat protein
MKNYLALSVLVTSLLAATGCATKQGYVAKGNKLLDTGKYAEASLNYRKAIQKDPQYGEAYYGLGLSALKQHQPALAYDALLRAVQFLPNNISAKEKFADVCLAFYLSDPRHPQTFYGQLTQVSDELLAKNPNSFKGLEIKAYIASTDRKPQEAVALFRTALRIDASDPAVSGALAQNLFRNGQSQEAEKVALDLITRQQSYGPIYDLLYEWYSTTRPADAENILKKKVNNNPKNADYLLELAAHYAHFQRHAEMKGALQRLLDDPKDFPQARLWVGDFYMRLRDYPEAMRHYEEGVRNDPKGKILYQKRTTSALVAQGKNDEAFRIVEQILKEDANEHEALQIHASLLLRSGKQESVDGAEREFLTLSKETPNDASVWFGLGEAKRLKGDLDGARAQYLEALRKQKDYLPPRYALAEVGLMDQRPQESLQQANEILKIRPNDNSARLLHARSLIATGDLSTARDELSAMAKTSPRDPQLQLELGLVALSEQKYAEARSIFNKLESNGDARSTVGLSDTYLAQGQFERAFEILQEGFRRTPDSALIHEEFAKIAALTGRYDLAVTEYQKLISSEPKSIGNRLLLAESYELKGDHSNAIVTCQQAEKLAPTDLRAGVALAQALAKGGRISEARTQYEKVIRLHPDDPGALNNAAFFLSETGGDLDEALKLAQRALEKVPGQPAFSDTIGYIYLKKGQRDSAIRTFSNLARKYPTYATFRYHLGLALLENGDTVGAKKELQAALANHPAPQDMQRIKGLLDNIS